MYGIKNNFKKDEENIEEDLEIGVDNKNRILKDYPSNLVMKIVNIFLLIL